MQKIMTQNVLDSRAICRADCYAQRFMRPGRYSYHILPAHTALLTDDRPFVIEAEEADGRREMTQHNVQVKANKAAYVPDNRELKIAVGDLVLWNCASADAPPFAVIGDREFFDSSRLTNECGYSHAFGMPGEYKWRDAYGSDISGVVTVSDPDCQCEDDVRKWREKLAEGAVVMIADGGAEPSKISVVVGQTVFFAVVTSKGISITDERYLHRERG